MQHICRLTARRRRQPRPAADVDAAPLVVEEEVVSVITGRQIRLGCSRSRFKQHEASGDSVDYPDDPRRLAKGHRKVREMSGAPACERTARVQINDNDLVRIGNVHERLAALAVDLEALRVCAERDGPLHRVARRIKDRESPRAIADHDLPGRWIDPHVVSVVPKRN
jgi:hypothetical protein